MTMNRLVARIELENGISFSVAEGSLPLLIGRGSSCGLCVPIPHISRRHCELYLENDVLCLRDMSSNGTTVGSKRLKGESISIQGRTQILIAGEARITVTPADLDENMAYA